MRLSTRALWNTVRCPHSLHRIRGLRAVFGSASLVPAVRACAARHAELRHCSMSLYYFLAGSFAQ